ncbi:TIGR03084 family metal-binding protein [Actinokineospora sp. UTMC 2448]|uniref:TIGR03084 family metal-binding protein n=1 Tax=Actinokineospora sp. UTMC 2448 TaxID=2268449 RepID=UPI00216435D8|nr:TIGR03084 family metal-binding protein [Actinokineospora sp. UTMC 2448]UVS81466.1 putative Actinobacterial protein [Actinokineospora sp. UTMC 2448]
MTEQRDVFSDLAAEADEVDRLLSELDEAGWALPTPAPGWTVAHQVAHVAFVFRLAGLAASDPKTFAAMAAAAGEDFEGAVNAALGQYLSDPPSVLFARWRDERDTAIKALAAVPGNQVVPWLVRPLPPAVLACAGFMELFAHGQDIADALGVRRERTDGLWHVALFTTLVWDFGYQSRGLTPPAEPFRFELTAPSGALWTFGPADAAHRISGPAEDLCLLATRRRHRDDLALVADGADADHWLDIAQAYRGPAGPGRAPGQFADR